MEEDFGVKEKDYTGVEGGIKRGIPTLDFEVYWDEWEERFKYRYFEKEMRNPIVIQKRSAMDRRQKYGILSQELIRRLGNISEGKGEQEEHISVVEGYTRQLKRSGYNFKETKEIVRSGYIGFKRKKERRQKLGIPMHREGRNTIVVRTRKKLLDKRMWYRREKGEEDSKKKKWKGVFKDKRKGEYRRNGAKD